MSLAIFSVLLVAAALHAGWNALVRRDADRNAAATAIAAGGAVVGAAVLPFLPPVALAAIPFILASSITHIAYYGLVARAYRQGELSVVYPIMRGLAPVIVTVIGAFAIEPATPAVFGGVMIIGLGMVALGADGLKKGRHGLGAAVGNAMVIAAYTLIDGLGARVSGAPATYAAWLEVGGGLATVAWVVWRNGRAILGPVAARAPLGLVGGAMSFGAYAIALWAMTVAPIGAVAAVRESSVLIATAIGAIALHERFGMLRWAAAALVVGGLAFIKLGGGAT
jgi:drug/metabolite transporter (DMT)-like permease